jgi:hypothetical protein
MSWVALFHLNGNCYKMGERAQDKHAIPLSPEDKIWGGMEYSNSGCREFIDIAMKMRIPIVVEGKPRHDDAMFIDLINKSNA